jgi:hypothetical protein
MNDRELNRAIRRALLARPTTVEQLEATVAELLKMAAELRRRLPEGKDQWSPSDGKDQDHQKANTDG